MKSAEPISRAPYDKEKRNNFEKAASEKGMTAWSRCFNRKCRNSSLNMFVFLR
jgi:hypothetical protein